MKKIIAISLILFLIGTSKSFAQTEEYAIVDVIEIGKRKIIRITVGSQPSIEKEWDTQKTEIKGDFSPVVLELQNLNMQGFELLNMSTTYTTASGGSTAVTIQGDPRFTFIMVKKKK